MYEEVNISRQPSIYSSVHKTTVKQKSFVLSFSKSRHSKLHCPPPVKQFGHTDWIRAVAFSFDGKQLVSGSVDERVRLGRSDGRTGKQDRERKPSCYWTGVWGSKLCRIYVLGRDNYQITKPRYHYSIPSTSPTLPPSSNERAKPIKSLTPNNLRAGHRTHHTPQSAHDPQPPSQSPCLTRLHSCNKLPILRPLSPRFRPPPLLHRRG